MGLERRSLNNIDIKFAQKDITPPSMWWEYGTLWADTNDEQDVQIIKEGLEEMLMPHCEVKVSKLKATDTEPWDQYAFDVCDKVYNYILKEVKNLIFNKMYVDDIVNFISLKTTLDYLELQNCTNTETDVSQEQNVKYNEETIKRGAESLELSLMSLVVLLFRHSNFYLKSFEGIGKNAILINN